MRTQPFLQALSNLFATWAKKPRLCYICEVPIQDFRAVLGDHHLCSECHALTRPLARRRRKERRRRRALREKTKRGTGKPQVAFVFSLNESELIETVRRMMMERFSDKLSMEEIAEFAYTLARPAAEPR
jgi:hypothetical protein